LPEVRLTARLELPRRLLFQHVKSDGKRRSARLSGEKMHMLGHEHITGNDKFIALPHRLQSALEGTIGCRVAEQRLPAVATESEKVEATSFLVANEPF
jgi:hypothetical protein